jgi:hypothetical protein
MKNKIIARERVRDIPPYRRQRVERERVAADEEEAKQREREI